MSELKKAPALSNFAAFVLGDIKGGEHAHAFRMSTVRTALEQAFKGNYSPLSEALGLTEGKAKKARAYHAAFVAAGVHADPLVSTVKKVPYAGKLDSKDNADARAMIESNTHAATMAFEEAFNAVMAQKAERKAKAEPVPAPVATPAPTAVAEPSDDTGTTTMDIDLASTVEAVADAIKGGLLDGADLLLLRAALASYDAAQAIEQASAVELTPA